MVHSWILCTIYCVWFDRLNKIISMAYFFFDGNVYYYWETSCFVVKNWNFRRAPTQVDIIKWSWYFVSQWTSYNLKKLCRSFSTMSAVFMMLRMLEKPACRLYYSNYLKNCKSFLSLPSTSGVKKNQKLHYVYLSWASSKNFFFVHKSWFLCNKFFFVQKSWFLCSTFFSYKRAGFFVIHFFRINSNYSRHKNVTSF